MWHKFLALFRLPDLRKKILIVFILLVVFRVMANIPLPGVNVEKLKLFFESNQALGLFNIFSGGAFRNISIAMLGVMPFITASIIMQLLTMVFPNLKELFYEGTDKERARFIQYSRLLTVPLGAMQGFGFLLLLRRQGIINIGSPFDLLRDVVVLTTATVFLTWIGELITEQKIGDGVSLIIFVGIVINLPRQIMQTVITTDPTRIPNMVTFFTLALLIILGVVIIARGERRIPVSYAKQVRGTKIYGGASTYLPLRVNQAGVMPIIFALSILLFPQMIGNLFASASNPFILKMANLMKNFNYNSVSYLLLYFLLVFVFTFFYTEITFEPESIAENLQKRGGFIPGYRPGEKTTRFLSETSNRVTFFGAIFLGLIAILPIILGKTTGVTTMTLGGTGILIMVEVAIDTIDALEAQLTMREYETY